MAANMKAVKLRRKSIQNTMQITRAMELVASSRLRKAREQAQARRPYFQILHNTLTEIAASNTDFVSPYTKEGRSPRWCYVVIAGDRGLAGGYNSNLFKLVQMEAEKNGADYDVLPIGKKSVEYFRRRAPLITEEYAEAAGLSVSDCFEIAKLLGRQYCSGKFGHITLFYTRFLSMLSQKPDVRPLLPLSDFKTENPPAATRPLILYEPDSETVFNTIVPEYLAGLIYSAGCDSLACELASRRTAMDAATRNAGKIIEQLDLYYNRARQAGITREITEIVAGADEL